MIIQCLRYYKASFLSRPSSQVDEEILTNGGVCFPEDNVEIRKLSIENHGMRMQPSRLQAYCGFVMLHDDLAHRAFSIYL